MRVAMEEGSLVRPEREMWERAWVTRRDADIVWFSDEAPPEVAEALSSMSLPDGAGLDIGCGAGTITKRISERFRPTIGFDIALEAVRLASEHGGEGLHFVVAASPVLPFRTGRFAFIFDRGCLQHVPLSLWPAYFRELDRLLMEAGVALLMIPGRVPPRRRSLFGLRARVRRSRLPDPHKARSPTEIASGIRRSLPAGLADPNIRTYPVRLPSGGTRIFIRALIRKAGAAPSDR